MSSTQDDWKCVVKLSKMKDESGQSLDRLFQEPFGEHIHDKAELEQRIRRAQRAILNPSTLAKHFLNGPDEEPQQSESRFSSNYVSLEISGRGVSDLLLYDLPGDIFDQPAIMCC